MLSEILEPLTIGIRSVSLLGAPPSSVKHSGFYSAELLWSRSYIQL